MKTIALVAVSVLCLFLADPAFGQAAASRPRPTPTAESSWALGAGSAGNLPADYTPRSVLEKLIGWGRAAMDYSQYRWEKEAASITQAIVGSSVSLSNYEVSGAGITVTNGKATTGLRENIIDFFPYPVRGTKYYDSTGKPFRLYLVLRDTSDRLAMDISSPTKIDVVGRISSAALEVREGSMNVALEVEITTWSRSR